MANIRDLRQRITSVGNIQKITRAMEMVATTKLRRFQEKAVASQPYAEELDRLVRGLSSGVVSDSDTKLNVADFFQVGDSSAPTGVLFIGSSRGLCGAYNTNVQRELEAGLETLSTDTKLFVVGKKAMNHASRMEHTVAAYFEDLDPEKMDFSEAVAVSKHMVSSFRSGDLSRVFMCGTRFKSMVRYEPYFEAFLPIEAPEGEAAAEPLLEPNGAELLDRLVPRYLETRVFYALLEAVTSEYASRRFAMKNATDAAGDMKKDLTRSYNRARQQKITSEITEIVSGAEAL
ncbi:MAG TPA: ATP synthase F1 subunit gamma [Planctomycetes bacterium]|nr:ATP synthase F1 subunit gamma [Planctomycetota bacterium]